MQEVDVEIRPVNGGMATGAIAARLETQPAVRHVGGERIHMALQAQKPGFTADQQHLVDAAVRRVARRAAFDFHGGVLEDKRPAFFDVALRAGFPAALPQRGAVRSAMRIVAVRALHRAFGNAVVRGQRELRLDVAVASVAQFRLRLDQLAFVQPAHLRREFGDIEKVALRGAQAFRLRVPSRFRQMHRVAAIAGDAMLDMGGVREILLIAAALMAHQAALGILSGICVEREDQLAGCGGLGVVSLRSFFPVGMGLARAVAHFATGHRIRVRRLNRSMVSLAEFSEFRLVTRLASFRSCIASAGDRRRAATLTEAGSLAAGRVWPEAATMEGDTTSQCLKDLLPFIFGLLQGTSRSIDSVSVTWCNKGANDALGPVSFGIGPPCVTAERHVDQRLYYISVYAPKNSQHILVDLNLETESGRRSPGSNSLIRQTLSGGKLCGAKLNFESRSQLSSYTWRTL